MRKKLLVCVVFIFAIIVANAQADHICEARVVDGETGEALPMAAVRSTGGLATVANAEGYFKLPVGEGDSLTVSFVGYHSQTVAVGLLDSIVRLVPGSVVLGNVDVLPFDKRLDAIIKAAVDGMDANKDVASNFFYRQTTRLDGNTTSMVEAFFHAKSAFSLRDLMLITGRYSEDEAKDGIFGHSANLFVLSELSMVCKNRRLRETDFVSPLQRSYARYYDVSHDVIDEGRRTVYAIHFKPKEEYRRRMAFDGTIYVTPDGNEILKAEGRVGNVVILSSFGERYGNMVTADVRFYADYAMAGGYSAVRTLRIEASYYNKGIKVDFSSLMYNVGDMALAGEKKARPATDLRKQIDRIGYDADFWKRTEIVKRTKAEEWLAQRRDAEGAAAKASARRRNTATEDSLMKFVSNIGGFNRLFPQEKVYLHFDNTGYFCGETMWFSAYVVRTDRQRLTDMSRVLYVELLDPTGEIVETRKLRLDDGRGSGSIKLDKLLTSGFYEVRAYTRYMLNWDAAWIFSRVFPVFDALKDAGDYSRPVMAGPDYRKRLPSSRQKDSVGREAVNVAFYPEGGRLVLGLHSRVAFSVTDGDGRPFDAEGELVLADGKRIAVRTQREGRGVFAYTPASVPATLILNNSKGRQYEFALPAADVEGCVMSVDAVGDEYIDVEVNRTAGFADPLALVLVCGGNVDGKDIIAPTERTARRRFAKSDMAAGVSQLALIRPDGAIVAERMVFVYPHKGLDTMVIAAENALSPCGKVALDVRTLPGAVFSMAVRDKASEVNGQAGNAATWLLLASDLRGYIHNPEYYLEADDEAHRRAADLLLMVQGWRRYDIARMDSPARFEKQHPAEDRLLLGGQLYPSGGNGIVGGVSLTATLYNRAGESMSGETEADSAGRYVFSLPDCEGEWTLLLSAKKNGEAVKCRVGIDRNFSPAAQPLSPLALAASDAFAPTLRAVAVDSFEAEEAQLPMDERVHMIKEVQVKGKRLFENARAAWESEQRGAFWSDVRYDCSKAADEIYDRGGDMPSVFEWLAGKNSFFTGSAADMENIIDNVPDSLVNRYDQRVREGSKSWIPSSMVLLDNISDRQPGDAVYFQGDRNRKMYKFKELFYKESDLGHQLFAQTAGMSYKNRPIVWILNNAFYTVTQTSKSVTYEDFDAEEIRSFTKEILFPGLDNFKSVYVSEDEGVWRRYVTIRGLDRRSPVTVFLYSHHTFPAGHKGQRHTYFDGYSKVETFRMPDYSLMPKEVDHRRTLYWNPAVKADGRGRATVEFYNNSSCKELVVSAEGITDDGRAVVFK